MLFCATLQIHQLCFPWFPWRWLSHFPLLPFLSLSYMLLYATLYNHYIVLVSLISMSLVITFFPPFPLVIIYAFLCHLKEPLITFSQISMSHVFPALLSSFPPPPPSTILFSNHPVVIGYCCWLVSIVYLLVIFVVVWLLGIVFMFSPVFPMFPPSFLPQLAPFSSSITWLLLVCGGRRSARDGGWRLRLYRRAHSIPRAPENLCAINNSSVGQNELWPPEPWARRLRGRQRIKIGKLIETFIYCRRE